MNEILIPKQYFYQSLKISSVKGTNDDNINNVKNFVINNFDVIINYSSTLKNEHVTNYLLGKQFCPNIYTYNDNYILYYANFNHMSNKIDYSVQVIFIEVVDLEKLTHVVMAGFMRDLLIFIMQTIKISNNFDKEYDNYYECSLIELINDLIKPKNLNLTNISQKTNVELFDNIIDNINWAKNIFNKNIKDYVSNDKFITFNDGRIYNYTCDKFVTNEDRILVLLRGGIIFDNGINKILQALEISQFDNNPTVILVPNNLVNYWTTKMKLYLNDYSNITILGFTQFITYDKPYSNLIIDEIHELYSNENYAPIYKHTLITGVKSKWGFTDKPFCIESSTRYLLQYLTEINLTTNHIERAKWFDPLYRKIFKYQIIIHNNKIY